MCFTDVVTAYKELLREKTALEASLKALSTAQNSSSSDTKTTPIAKTQKQLVESTGEGYAVSTSRAGGSAGLQETSVMRLLHIL